jgi:hypothetical protein
MIRRPARSRRRRFATGTFGVTHQRLKPRIVGSRCVQGTWFLLPQTKAKMMTARSGWVCWMLFALPALGGIAPPRAAEASSPPTVAAEVDLSGCWDQGSWSSCTTGHQGPLTACFCRIDATRYRVDFQGRFFKILPFRYSMTMHVVGQEDGKLLLSGSHYLGRMFGTFHFRGEATNTQFVAYYHSCDDRGVFRLCRSCPSPCCP